MARTSDVDAAVARNLQALRRRPTPGDPFRRGVTQAQVAAGMAALGHATWRQHTVSELELGHRAVLLSEAQDLAAMFGVKLSQLMGNLGDR